MISYLMISLLALAIMWDMIDNAPDGYEDEHGFHYGYPPLINK